MNGPIGILLPRRPQLADLRRARELAGLLLEASAADGGVRSVAIGLPNVPDTSWRQVEQHLAKDLDGVVVRRLQWEPVPTDHAGRMFPQAAADLDLDGIETVHVPRDWGWNFQDCDALIMLADPGLGAPLTIKPTAFYVPDLAVRVVPEAFASSPRDSYWARQTDSFRIWRQAEVWTPDPATERDLNSYAGVRKQRIHAAPNLSDGDLPPVSRSPTRQSRLLWFIEPSPLYDLRTAGHALEIYLREGGRLSPLLVGANLDGFDLAAEAPALTALPGPTAELLYSVERQTVQSEAELVRLVSRSGALWSSCLAGGEGAAVLLAGRCGSHFIGPDYSTNREVVSGTRANASLYALNDPLAIVDALHQAEAAIGREEQSSFQPLSGREDRIRDIKRLVSALLEPGRER